MPSAGRTSMPRRGPAPLTSTFDVTLRVAGSMITIDLPSTSNPTCRLGAARAEARCGKRPREGEYFELSKHDVAPLQEIRVCRSGKVSAPTPGATQTSWRGCRRWGGFLWGTVTQPGGLAGLMPAGPASAPHLGPRWDTLASST